MVTENGRLHRYSKYSVMVMHLRWPHGQAAVTPFEIYPDNIEGQIAATGWTVIKHDYQYSQGDTFICRRNPQPSPA